MSTAKNGDTVKVHYTGTLDDGSVFDTSKGREPLEFTLGEGSVIPGFETCVIGMESGQSKTTHIPSAEAYGEPSDELIISVPKSNVPEDIKPEVGQQLAVNRPDGQPMPVIVKEVNEEGILLDANHPLAGKDLNFEIELVSIG